MCGGVRTGLKPLRSRLLCTEAHHASNPDRTRAGEEQIIV
jgi:hypothetical protein